MANNYYNNSSNIILPGTTAEAADVENKCDDIAQGFDAVEADTDNALKLTAVDNATRVISDLLSVRINKMLGFDSSGGLGLQVRRGTFKGDWAPATYYYQDDLVSDSTNALGEGTDSVFVCQVNHTSSASLVTDTASWSLMLGTDGLVLSKVDKAGDTMTGTLFSTTSDPALSITGSLGVGSIVFKNLAASVLCEISADQFNDPLKVETAEVILVFGTDGLITVTDEVSATPIPIADANLANKLYVDTADALKVDLAGDTMTGNLSIETAGDEALIELKPGITGGGTGLTLYDHNGVARGYVNMASSTGLIGMSNRTTGDVLMTSMYLTTDGNIRVNGAAPNNIADLTRKSYVDGKFAAGVSGTFPNPTSITVVDGLITAIS